jgi:glycosyltransferase involved in cell wall biosynthesis
VHTAFWRGNEGYIGPALDALTHSAPGALRLVGVGPQRNFTLRRWWDPVTAPATIAGAPITPVEQLAPWSALRDSVALWRSRSALAAALVSGEGIRAAAMIHGCDLWPLLEAELRGAALVQWPWSARAMDEAGAAIDALKCDTVVTYAEAGGWGRALILEARRRGVASAGLQHGFIYRYWLNYLHEPDEMEPLGADRGFPAPDKTLLFDRYAEAHMRGAGAFSADRLAVTGSPGRDALAVRVASFTAAERETARLEAGVVRYKQKLAVLAAKFTEIRTVLPALIAAVKRSPDIHLAIKAHPAESSVVYEAATNGIPNVTVLGADTDLARLLAAADVVVTRNSTVAIDALVLKRPGEHHGDPECLPALVIGQPSNLSPLVDEGVMLAADDEVAIGGALERLLYDREVRARLGAAADAFVERYEMRARGSAAARAAGVILEMQPVIREIR